MSITLAAADHEPRDQVLEYWFWTLHQPGLALLVDFIIRRPNKTAEVRVARWVDGAGEVARTVASDWSLDRGTLSLGDDRIDAAGSTGRVGDTAWSLTWDRGTRLVNPRPRILGPFHALDLETLIRPCAVVSGEVTVGDRRWVVDGAPAMLTHYWGPRLLERWAWVSATGFADDPELRLEAFVARSTAWGTTPAWFPVGYLWIGGAGSTELTVSPITGVVRTGVDGQRLSLRSARLDGRRHRLEAWAPTDAFVDLGEGISTTLLADAVVDGRKALPGSVGLEFRRAHD